NRSKITLVHKCVLIHVGRSIDAQSSCKHDLHKVDMQSRSRGIPHRASSDRHVLHGDVLSAPAEVGGRENYVRLSSTCAGIRSDRDHAGLAGAGKRSVIARSETQRLPRTGRSKLAAKIRRGGVKVAGLRA